MNKGIKFEQENLAILLYADDLVLLSENEEDLQQMINELAIWCSKWRMVVNTEKNPGYSLSVKTYSKNKPRI